MQPMKAYAIRMHVAADLGEARQRLLNVDSAPAERLVDDGGLFGWPSRLQFAVPESPFCHCALPKLIIYPI